MFGIINQQASDYLKEHPERAADMAIVAFKDYAKFVLANGIKTQVPFTNAIVDATAAYSEERLKGAGMISYTVNPSVVEELIQQNAQSFNELKAVFDGFNDPLIAWNSSWSPVYAGRFLVGCWVLVKILQAAKSNAADKSPILSFALKGEQGILNNTPAAFSSFTYTPGVKDKYAGLVNTKILFGVGAVGGAFLLYRNFSKKG